MPRLNHASRELTLSLALYGAPKVGKTAILHCIQDRVTPDRRGSVMPLGTEATLAPLLDWLPLHLGNISGWDASVHLYAIPDQRHADATRRVILADADAVLFAADAQAGRLAENVVALESLRANLEEGDRTPRIVPMVFLYTKNDLPPELLLNRTALNHELNPTSDPSFAVSALRGDGVLEALHAAISLVMRGLAAPNSDAS